MEYGSQKDILDLFTHLTKPVKENISGRRLDESTWRSLIGEGIGIAPRGQACSLFIRENMNEALNLARYFLKQNTFSDFKQAASTCRPFMNEEIYVFGLMYASLYRPDTKSLRLPPLEEILPYWYFPSDVIAKANHRVKAAINENVTITVRYRYAHTVLDPEFKLAYFREDIGLNSHHWHWHLIYPFQWIPMDPHDIKDRKGELFYYMHQQVIARYDIERLCNGLNRVRSLSDYHRPLEEAYFPNLTSTISGRSYSSRPANSILQDTEQVSVQRLILWKSRIMDAIHNGFVVNVKGEAIPLDNERGIDILGDIIESAAISVNRNYYGAFHNMGHQVISRAHDPQLIYGTEGGVMGFTATAMRDPIFYRWHKEVDDIFVEHKNTLPPYFKHELEWPDIRVNNIYVKGENSRSPNQLQTFWQEREVLLSSGLDFGRANPVKVITQHLQHEEFDYHIDIENLGRDDHHLLIRLLIAPIFNEFGERFTLHEQRWLFVELEKYKTFVRAGSRQVLRRNSRDSNVTTSTVQSFEQLGSLSPTQPPTLAETFCGCGWPSHLLLPRGRPEGMRFMLFVMISDWEKDMVQQGDIVRNCGSDNASYCGVRDKRYPDKRAMGFPFDRRFILSETHETLASMSNVAIQEIIITHTGQLLDAGGIMHTATIN